MTKKNVLIGFGVVIAVIVIGLGIFAYMQNQKLFTNISCNGENGKCAYIVKTGLGAVLTGRDFTKENVVQCSIENSKTPSVYELHLMLNNINNQIVLKSKNKEKITDVCTGIRENRTFIYEFRHK